MKVIFSRHGKHQQITYPKGSKAVLSDNGDMTINDYQGNPMSVFAKGIWLEVHYAK